MSLLCDGILSGDILADCENPMVGGLEVNVLLVNHSDIDKTACTFSPTNKTVLTNFQLKSGKTGYLLEGVKQINSLSTELVPKETSQDKMKHMFSGMILNYSADNKAKLYDMIGGLFAVIVELKWKGVAGADAFQIGGFDSGMRLSAVTWSSKENDGNISFELSSVEGYEETKQTLSIFETSYALTSTAFGNKFLQA
jgi:hypothetical protein